MKQTIELTCAVCGCKFIAEADYILPGISGLVVNKSGKVIELLDPTAEHLCGICVAETCSVILRKCYG